MKKKIILPLAILTCFSLQSMAQDQQQIERQDQRLKKVITELSLDDQQAADFTEIYHKRQAELKEEKESAMANRTTDREIRMETMKKRKASREEYQLQLKEVLNEEQLEKLEKMTEERKENRTEQSRNKSIKMNRQNPEHRLMKDQPIEDNEDTEN